MTGDPRQRGREFEDWSQPYSLQLCSAAEGEEDAVQGSSEGRSTEAGDEDASNCRMSDDRLSTIPEEEESSHTDTGEEAVTDYLSHSDEQFQRILEATGKQYNQFMEGTVPEYDSDSEDPADESIYRTPLSM